MNINSSRSINIELGIEFDNSLNFNHHAEQLCGKLNKIGYQLPKIKYEVNLKTLILVYYVNVYSLKSYGIINWGCEQNFSDSQKTIMPPKMSIKF